MSYMSNLDIVLGNDGLEPEDYIGNLGALHVALERYKKSARLGGDGDDLAMSLELYFGPKRKR